MTTMRHISQQIKMASKSTRKQEWFKIIDSHAYMWDRKNSNTLYAYVNVGDFMFMEYAIHNAGGAVMSKKHDPTTGKYYITIREPKMLVD
jgi:phage antirepressor YoqD-like protein